MDFWAAIQYWLESADYVDGVDVLTTQQWNEKGKRKHFFSCVMQFHLIAG